MNGKGQALNTTLGRMGIKDIMTVNRGQSRNGGRSDVRRSMRGSAKRPAPGPAARRGRVTGGDAVHKLREQGCVVGRYVPMEVDREERSGLLSYGT